MKLTNYCLCFFILLVVGCASETVEEKIDKAEQAYAANPGVETGQPLMELLVANVSTGSDTAIYRLSQAATIYQQVSDQLTSGANKAFLLKMKAHTEAIRSGMETLSKQMYNEAEHQLDADKANDYINTCQVYALIQPDDTKSPVYLFKAAETARAMRNFDKAIELYDNIYDNYPDYEKHAQTLFLKAFTLDNDLKRHDEAKGLYELFLKKYPDNDFADDTQFLLANLGKSDEEIIQKFEEKK